ncbi:MAG: hypothetical protein KGI54_15160, partial [Pseudomonadota bacterium]|nr:hypothetical protein [Pseudomonadota bacterium]
MQKKCGAKTRSGHPCKSYALENGRCRMHGGKSKGAENGNKRAIKPGSLYSKHLTDDEKKDFDALELGSIDDELKLCRIRLARALELETKEPELSEITEREGVESERKLKTRDYHGIINTLMGRIESLETRRLALIGQSL